MTYPGMKASLVICLGLSLLTAPPAVGFGVETHADISRAALYQSFPTTVSQHLGGADRVVVPFHLPLTHYLYFCVDEDGLWRLESF